MTVTSEQIFEATGLRIDINPKLHALEIIENNRAAIYAHRTSVNRELKDRQSTAKQLQESLPEDPPEGDWLTQYNCLSEALDDFDRDTTSKTRKLEGDLSREIEGLNEGLLTSTRNLERVAMERIEEIRQQLKLDSQELKNEYENARQDITEDANMHIMAWGEERDPKREHIIEQRQHAKTMADMSVRYESAKHLLLEMNEGAVELKLGSDRMTRALGGLEHLKEELTANLPISGLEIRDGELYLDGIKFSRWNEARRVTTAIELARLSAGNLGLVVVDGLERLNGETFEAFSEYLKNDETSQYVVTRVTDDAEMSIVTY